MTEKAIEVAGSNSKEITNQAWTDEQVQLIKNTVARGSTDDELKLFLYTARRTGLDPLTKQIHFVKRKVWNKQKQCYEEIGTIQTGIDGYRAIAERSKTLAGIDDAVVEETEGSKYPSKSSVTVYRMVEGQRVGFTASARWTEYASTDRDGKPQQMWNKMPYLMLGKCAEALALRKAFPNDLSGLYTFEEMQQADNEEKPRELPKVVAPVDPTLALKQKIMEQLKALNIEGITREGTVAKLEELTGLTATDGNLEEISSRLAVLISEKNGQ
jgi:phage recombination protein Bet